MTPARANEQAARRRYAAQQLENLAREFERWLNRDEGPRVFFADPVIDECRRRAARLRKPATARARGKR